MTAEGENAASGERELLLAEYGAHNDNLRHYHNQRFAQLTLWLAISAAVGSVLFNADLELKPHTMFMLKLFGAIASLAFWVMDERIVEHWRHFWARLIELEGLLGFRAWTTRPKHRLLGSTNATRLLYATVGGMWIASMIWGR
jgi:hypothetical protein